MKNYVSVSQKIVVDIHSPSVLKEAVFTALNLATGYASQVQAIKNAYLETLAAPENFKPAEFVQGVAPIACEWFDSVRYELAEEYGQKEGDGKSWADMAEYKAIQSGFTAFRQSVARETGGVTFKVSGRVSPQQALAGDTVSWELDAKRYEAKPEKKETAEGQNDAPSAGNDTAPEEKSEKFNGQKLAASLSESEARSALLNILNQYPELTTDSAVKNNFKRNFEKACKKIASLKKLASKKAA